MTSRKHYEAVAAAIAEVRKLPDGEGNVALSTLIGKLGDIYAADNPNFDRARFLAASGAS